MITYPIISQPKEEFRHFISPICTINCSECTRAEAFNLSDFLASKNELKVDYVLWRYNDHWGDINVTAKGYQTKEGLLTLINLYLEEYKEINKEPL